MTRPNGSRTDPPPGRRVTFRLWGSLTAEVDGTLVALGPQRQRCVLAALLFNPGRPISANVLIERVWDDRPPDDPRALLATYVSRLRRAFADAAGSRLPPDLLLHAPAGYVVNCPSDAVDLHQARVVVARAQAHVAAADDAVAVLLFRQVQKICVGVPLADVSSDWATQTREALERERVDLAVQRLDVELRLGRHAEALAELAELAAANPLHEQLIGMLMLALHRSGRTAEALETFIQVRRRLSQRLGCEPGQALHHLHQQILRREPLFATARIVHQTPPGQLPANLADFTGRTDQVADLSNRLVRAAQTGNTLLVSIEGQPGVGKTALAVHVAHAVRHLFPDGQLYLELNRPGGRPVDPPDALADFLRALAVPATVIAEDLDGRSRQLRTHLAGRRVLMVLDDVADERQVRPLLPAAPSVVLLTSRRRLAGLAGAVHIGLPVLSSGEALELLSAVVGKQRAAAEPEHAQGVVSHCGYLPLAVRIAGARLAGRPHWSIGALSARLGDECRRLSELQIGDIGVRASLTLSYQTVPRSDQLALHAFAVADLADLGDWAVAALLGEDRASATEACERLSDVHLVEVVSDAAGQIRFRIHDLVRLFARERLAREVTPADQNLALCRVLDAAIELACAANRLIRPRRRRPGPPESNWAPDRELVDRVQENPAVWLETERAVLTQLLRRAHDRGMWQAVWCLADAVSHLTETALHPDWRSVADLAADAARRRSDSQGEKFVRSAVIA